MNIKEYNNLLAFHPGYYINEIIEDMKITKYEFAKKINITLKTLNDIINGKVNITNDIAEKLSIISNISVDTWLNLQNEYNKIINKEM